MSVSRPSHYLKNETFFCYILLSLFPNDLGLSSVTLIQCYLSPNADYLENYAKYANGHGYRRREIHTPAVLNVVYLGECLYCNLYTVACIKHGSDMSSVTVATTSLFVADTINRCAFHWCIAGRWLQAEPFVCPGGTAVRKGYVGTANPCSSDVPGINLCQASM